jgi:hypothetical protein
MLTYMFVGQSWIGYGARKRHSLVCSRSTSDQASKIELIDDILLLHDPKSLLISEEWVKYSHTSQHLLFPSLKTMAPPMALKVTLA